MPGLETYKTPKHDELIAFMKDIYPFKNRVFNCYLLFAGLIILAMTGVSQYDRITYSDNYNMLKQIEVFTLSVDEHQAV